MFALEKRFKHRHWKKKNIWKSQKTNKKPNSDTGEKSNIWITKATITSLFKKKANTRPESVHDRQKYKQKPITTNDKPTLPSWNFVPSKTFQNTKMVYNQRRHLPKLKEESEFLRVAKLSQ